MDSTPNFKDWDEIAVETRVERVEAGSRGGRALRNQRFYAVFTGKVNMFCEEYHYEY